MSLPLDEIRVLHIEDDPAFADLTADYLSKIDETIEVDSVARGQPGLRRLEEAGYDCLVCDYELPGLNGIEILETVREAYPELPFILFTGKGSEEVASDAISAGVTDYLRKSTGGDQFEVLANRIRNAVEARRARERLGERETALERERTFIDQALDTIDDVFYVVDEDGSLRRWNSAATDTTGYTDGEIEEMQAVDFFPPDERERVSDAIEEGLATGEATIEAPFLTKDGDRVLHEFSGIRLTGPEGEVQGLVGIARDIRERKQHERRLERLNQRYEAVFEHAADGLFLLDVEWREEGPRFTFETLNSSVRKGTGLDVEEMRGKTPREALGEELGAQLEARFRRCAEEGEVVAYEHSGTVPAGEQTWHTKLSPVEVDGEVVQVAGVSRNVTERRRREERLRSFRGAVEQAADAIAILEDGEYVFVDQTHADMYGFDDAEQLVGNSWQLLYDEQEIERFEAEVFPQLEEEGRWRGEATGTRPDGSTFPVEVSLTIVDDGRLVCAARDITERKQRERQLARRTRRLETLVSNLPGVVYRCPNEPEWPFDQVGGECEELTGYEADAFRDGELTWAEIIHPEDREGVWDGVQAAVEADEPFEFEYRIETRGGETRWVWERGRGLWSDDGSLDALEGFITDVTDRRRREEALRESNRRLEAVLETADTGIFIKGPDGRYRLMNRRAYEMFDIDPDLDPLELTDEDLYPDAVVERSRASDEAVLEAGEPIEVEETMPTGEGERTFLIVKSPMVDEDGEVQGICGVATDITDRKRAEAELREKNERLAEFASIVSHDLRNPLNVASGNLALAMDVDGLEHPRLETVEQAHDRMSDLIDEVLALARYGEDVTDVDRVSLAEVARTAWANVETDGARLAVEGDAELDADEGRLTQLLENLHRNAVDHAGPEPEVRVGALEGGFFVEDDGPGIPEDERSKVLESGYSTAEEGTGFGLGIVRQIAQAHGWSVQIEEGRDGGARFEFRSET